MTHEEVGRLREVVITTILDNEVFKEGLESAWALSFHVNLTYEKSSYEFLVDVGGSFEEWKNNVEKLNLDLSKIDSIFITHLHGDHVGALLEVLEMIGKGVKIYSPGKPWIKMSKLRKVGAELIICDKEMQIYPNVFSTGPLDIIKEQSVVINLENVGLIILVGCAHPGLPTIIEKAKEITKVEKIHAVLGGFHLLTYEEGKEVGDYLSKIGIDFVSPMHCTSDEAKKAILEIVGENKFIKNGSGRVCIFKTS